MKTILLVIFSLCFLSSLYAQGKLLDSLSLEKQHIYHSIEQALKQPQKVYKLNLSRQKLTQIPPEVYQFVNLQQLDLSYNEIVQIPKEIGLLKNLQKLDLTVNKLKELPATLSLLKNLQELMIGSNKIKLLPEGIKELKKLLLLEVEDNLIPKKDWSKIQQKIPNCEVVFE